MDALLDTLSAEFARSPGPAAVVIVVRIAGAAILCALIGLEREMRAQSAGLRTTMLIGIASAAFGIIGLAMLETYGARSDVIRVDPLRLIEAVTGGVAFLAAGLIVFARGAVHGLTTGAAMWLAAACGLAAGVGQWFLAVLAAAAGLIVLGILRRLEIAFGLRKGRQTDEEAEEEPGGGA